jgi:hypothetical protein
MRLAMPWSTARRSAGSLSTAASNASRDSVTRRRVEQRKLAEVVAGSEGDDVATASGHLHGTVGDHEEFLARVTLAYDDLARGGISFLGTRRELLELLLRALREHRNAREVNDVRGPVVAGHDTSGTRSGAA